MNQVIKFPDRLDTPFSPRAEPASVIILPVIRIPEMKAEAKGRSRRGQRIKSTPEKVDLRRQDRKKKLELKKLTHAEACVHAAVVYLSMIDLEPAAVVAFIRDGKVPLGFAANQIDVELQLALGWLRAFAVSWGAARAISEPFSGPAP